VKPVRSTFTVGLLLRGEFRRYLLRRDIEFTEDKGWLDSFFVVHSTREEYQILREMVRIMNS
jgi:hypothetical protein